MKATLLLCDAAQAVNGKLYILGGGWSVAGPDPPSFGLALKIEVPWDKANTRNRLELQLFDADGQPVVIESPGGRGELKFAAQFEVGRPPGLAPGTPLDYVMAINFESVPLPPGQRMEWRLSINGHSAEEWRVGFTMRPSPSQQSPGPSA